MKKTLIGLVLGVLCITLLLTPAVASGFQASSSSEYDISVPAFGNAWSREFLSEEDTKFQTRLIASGGKNIAMTVCNSTDRSQELGPVTIVSPNPDAFYNLLINESFDRLVAVRLNSVFGVIVTVRAQGVWYWNVPINW